MIVKIGGQASWHDVRRVFDGRAELQDTGVVSEVARVVGRMVNAAAGSDCARNETGIWLVASE